MKTKIIVDSTFKLPVEFIREHNIVVVPLNVLVEGKTYLDEIDITLPEVMEYVNNGVKATSSQPSPVTFLNAFEDAKKEGVTDILCMTISSTLSGTFQSANIAASEVKGVMVWLLDTLSTSVGSEIVCRLVIRELNKGKSIKEVMDWIEKVKLQSGVMLGMENLQALKLSGRITKIKATIGNLLRVKPLLEYDKGKLHVVSKIRTESGMIDYIINRMKEEFEGVKTTIHIAVSHIRAHERAMRVKEKIEEVFQSIKVYMGLEVSSVVAVNLGKGGIGVAWLYE